MGEVSGNALGLDIDGPTAMKRVEQKRMEMSTNLRVSLDNTMMTKTGSGGMHVIFRVEGSSSSSIQGNISQEKLWSDGQTHSQILLQGNKHYFVSAPSIHPNNKGYDWNGKEPQLITRQELDELIRLLSAPGLQSKPPRTPKGSSGHDSEEAQAKERRRRPLTPEETQRLFKWIKPLYIPGDRDSIILYLSGAMRKDAGYSHEDTKNFFTLLCNASEYSDEDLNKSLKTVDRTYRIPIEDVNGKSGLYDTLVKSHEGSVSDSEYQDRAEAFSRICQIINGEPETPEGENLEDDGDGDDDKDKANNNKKKYVSSGEMLIKQKSVEDETTSIISFLALEVMNRVALKAFLDTHEIIYYDKMRKYYRFGGESIIDAEIEKIVQEINAPFTIRSYIKSEVQKCIADRNIVSREEFDADPYTINLNNCLLDIISMKQMDQTPEHLTLSKFPIDYDPTAECPRIERFLGEVIQDVHKLREVLKFFAYLLLKDCRYEKALMLLGRGANGKSVLIKLLETFVGRDNCCNLSLHEMEEDRFGRARLFGKALNTYADNKSQRLKETGNLKTVISGDTIEGQNKFKPRFSFRPRAKIAISTNNPPETDDKTHAFYRRWLIVMLERIFGPTEDPNSPNKWDVNLIHKLTTAEELSGLLNLALRYLPILIKENGFTEEPLDKVRKEYERKADHVARYLAGYCVIGSSSKKDYFTKTNELYEHYVKVCNENNIRPLDENVFGSRLVEHGVLRKQRRLKKSEGGGREYVYEPIVLKETLRQTQSTMVLDGNDLSQSVAGHTPSLSEEEGGGWREGQPTAITSTVECPHCALPGNNTPIFRTDNLRELQLHFIFKHPELDYEEAIEDIC